MIDIVTVVNDYKVYDDCIRNNPAMNAFNLVDFDNRTNSKGITAHYNDYLRNKMDENRWVVFCHQDFAFHENIEPKLNALDRSAIYGVIGAFPEKEFVAFLRLKRFKINKFKLGFVKKRTRFGQMIEGTGARAAKVGKFVKGTRNVDTVDCCCLIVSVSLIRKHQLRFDENLKWHLYSEDFSLQARQLHGIPTKVVQTDCRHLSPGDFSGDFNDSLHYLKKKYPGLEFASTCFDGYYDTFKKEL